ncbi:hypothetical protein X732_32535 [Mesorhizobium sp. L2C066B000]|nr:hypothetical protein X732_32535 [Mesorhizobium sp. L2C066B000]
MVGHAGNDLAGIQEPEIRDADRHRTPIGDDEGKAARHCVGDERDDERREPDDRDQKAIDRAEHKTDRQAGSTRGQSVSAIGHRQRGHHSGQGKD